MKKRLLATLMMVCVVATTLPFSAVAADKTVTVTNVDGTKSEYKYDDEKLLIDTDKNGATIFVRKEDGYVFYPNTKANNGFTASQTEDKVPSNSSGLEVDKNVTQYPINDKGEYTLTLESFVTGKLDITPMDIVLVLDQSGTMYDKFNYKEPLEEKNTRQYALKKAVNEFLDIMYKNATTVAGVELDKSDYIDHRVALVAYEQKTQILSGENTNESAFVSITDERDVLKACIEDLPKTKEEACLEGGYVKGDGKIDPTQLETRTHLGMKKANEVLSADTTSEQRDKIVILVSDGVPASRGYITYNGNSRYEKQWGRFTENSAHVAINEAHKSKTEYGADVFAIGVINYADPNIISGEIVDGKQNTSVGATWKADTGGRSNETVNRFFNMLTSNSDNALDLGAVPTGRTSGNEYIEGWKITEKYNWENKEYYKRAKDVNELNKAFEDIASKISITTVGLPETTQVQDYLSKYFRVPEGFDTSQVSVYEVESTGGTKAADGSVTYQWKNSAKQLTPEKDGIKIQYVTTENGVNEGVIVEGFDYNKKFLSINGRDNLDTSEIEKDYHGSKLVIQFNIIPVDGFLGGNDVVTNTANSGVYVPVPKKDEDGNVIVDEDGNIVYEEDKREIEESYTPPNTNVAVTYDIETVDQTVYLGNSAMLYKILKLDNHIEEGILSEFVNIQLAIYEKDALVDEKGEFSKKLKVGDNEYPVYKNPDKYFYMVDGVKHYTDKGSNYETDKDGNLFYIMKKDDGGSEVISKHKIDIEVSGYYYLDEKGMSHPLTAEQEKYYKSVTLASFYVPAGMAPKQAKNLVINKDQIILPAETTDYDVCCFVVPNDEDDETQGYLAEQLNQTSTEIKVYVIQPQISTHDMWVDYGTQIEIQKDGTMPIKWRPAESTDKNQGELHHANAAYAPTVYYIYQDLTTGEYFKSLYRVDWNNDGKCANVGGQTPELEPSKVGSIQTQKTWDGFEFHYTVVPNLETNIEREKYYQIVGIETLSSEGKNKAAYWSPESEVYKKTGEEPLIQDDQIHIHLNKYDVDITKTVTTTESEWETYPQSFIFDISQTAYDYKQKSNENIIVDDEYKGDYVVDGNQNKYAVTLRKPQKTEVIMEPSEFKKAGSPNADGTFDYTCTKTIADLYAGLETKVWEDEDWSWRYKLTETSVNTDAKKYGTITTDISEKQVITVNYTHNLWEPDSKESEQDLNKNGLVDALVDITGDGVPDSTGHVYRDRNQDGYVDVDLLSPKVTADELEKKTYTNLDIPFDLDHNGVIDLIISAQAATGDGRRKIVASQGAPNENGFIGYYINKEGNIETGSGELVYNRLNKYLNNAYVTSIKPGVITQNLSLQMGDVYRYMNAKQYVVFAEDAKGGAPENGQISTYFTNQLLNDQWLSHDAVKANEFDKLTVDTTGSDGGEN